jgi:hypothetical protein
MSAGIAKLARVTVFAVAAAMAANATPAAANTCGPRLIVDYQEDVPSDLFILHNASNPGWSLDRVEIDFAGSRGGLIFDVTEHGAGVSAYYPFREVGGGAVTSSRSEVTDGDTLLTLTFTVFLPGDRYVFAIDVDDTRANSEQTQVSAAELDGSEVRAFFVRDDGVRQDLTTVFGVGTRADTGEVEACVVS